MTSSLIKRLPDNVINQIKAGEVIERPFNVVKELVENALDASATAIKIELLDGGKRLIQISDNGSGIPREHIPLAIERHTTSKLSAFEDLESLHSFGFRGEALASIASVSKFSVKTKMQADSIGYETVFENGLPIQTQDVVITTGTTMTVKDIFQNVPARLKFLRSTATEFSYIQEFLTAMCLAFPHVSFHFMHNGRTVFDYKSKNSPTHRFHEVMGMEASHYAEINFTHGQFSLSGFSLLPESIRSPQNSMIIFVNGRFVKDKLIRAGIYQGYQGLLMKGVTPGVALFMNIDPKMIDINAHPSKTEIRFYDPMMIQDFVARSIENAVKKKLNQTLQVQPTLAVKMHHNIEETQKSQETQSSFNRLQMSSHSLTAEVRHTNFSQVQERSANIPNADAHQVRSENILFQKKITTNVFTNARYLNQFAQCFLIFENESTLWFVDQHAFHERILFEEIQSAYKENKRTKQMLLNPVLIPTHHLSMPVYQEHAQLIGNLGFEIEILKNDHLAIHSIPTFLNQKYLVPTFVEISQKLCREEAPDTPMIYHHCFSTIACHSAIRAGESLSAEFVQKLINRAYDVDFFAHCPHGRPVIRKFSQKDVERWFERI